LASALEAINKWKAIAEVLTIENHNQHDLLEEAKKKCGEINALKRQLEVTQDEFSKFQDVVKSSLDNVKKKATIGIQICVH